MQSWMTAIEETALAIVVVVNEDKNAKETARSLRKLTSFRNRSPSVHSPATKARKASQGLNQISSFCKANIL